MHLCRFPIFWFLAALVIGCSHPAVAAPTSQPAGEAVDSHFAPYSADRDHLWNRLHRALFVRAARDGRQYVHSNDPLLYSGGTFLVDGESHRQAIALLDEFLAAPTDPTIDQPLKRFFLQHDLWATFDYAATSPEWIRDAKDEPAALALRTRLAKAIAMLALEDHEIDTLPDNYVQAVKSHQFATDYDPEHPQRPFLPSDLFDPSGPWVRFHDVGSGPMARQHFDGAGGRAMHVIFLRLPDGRAATEKYLKELHRDAITQFPPGTMAAMVRRALAVNRAARVRLAPVTELVQIRVYGRIPADPRGNFHGDPGEQDVYELALDRAKLFGGEPGLRAVGPGEPAEPFERDGGDPFEHPIRSDTNDPMLVQGLTMTAMKSCAACHQAPGVYSVLSMQRGLRLDPRTSGREIFRTYDWNVEVNYTLQAKTQQFRWGLLQGMLEADHNAKIAP